MEPALCTLITGASSGIGREIAVRLSPGRKLILHGRDVQRLEETRSRCAQSAGHTIWAMDLGKTSEIEAGLSGLLAGEGLAVACFVHCAGLLKVLPMRNMDLVTAEEMMRVNFLSAVELVRLLLKRSLNHRLLRNVLFVSSTASQFGARGFNLYCASKGALDSLMRALAVELAPDIRVNSVLPGGVKTPMTGAMFNDPELASRMAAGYPLGVGEPSDIAAAVQFLVSDQARWITGQQLVVDGGRTINVTA
jgi:NAD(P)-dependent dehydrogenase (short-subunit alcohol dehydrogenase family)